MKVLLVRSYCSRVITPTPLLGHLFSTSICLQRAQVQFSGSLLTTLVLAHNYNYLPPGKLGLKCY